MEKPIIFFDGYCGLCNWFVDFALSHDRRHALLFSPLQGESAKTRVHPLELDKLESIVLWDNGQTYRQSEAILRALSHMGGFWRIFGVLRIFPRPLRDWVYHFISLRRYQWFGKRETCRLPTPSERALFLD